MLNEIDARACRVSSAPLYRWRSSLSRDDQLFDNVEKEASMAEVPANQVVGIYVLVDLKSLRAWFRFLWMKTY
jgi:hypothetical protein